MVNSTKQQRLYGIRRNEMAVKTARGYLCGYCGKPYNDAAKADLCRDRHELIYVPLTQEDLNNLIHFVHTKEDQFLTASLVSTLQRYVRGS